MDLTIEDEKGKTWDLPTWRLRKSEEELGEEVPWLLALPLLCSMFATVQSPNFTRRGDNLIMDRMKKDMAYVEVLPCSFV